MRKAKAQRVKQSKGLSLTQTLRQYVANHSDGKSFTDASTKYTVDENANVRPLDLTKADSASSLVVSKTKG